MKIVVFTGGIGNQLFQYMYCMHIKSTGHENVYAAYQGKDHNGYEIDRYFDCYVKRDAVLQFFVRIIYRFRDLYHIQAMQRLFVKEDGKRNRWGFIHEGLWQDKRYLDDNLIDYKELVLSERNDEIKHQMVSSNSVAIHVRRGDYLSPRYRDWFWHLDETDYYRKSIEYVESKLGSCSFFVFSDDIEWCRTNLPIKRACYIDWNKGDDSIYDMYLMSQAIVNIIANSTFSFWAAYLNKRSELTIYPLRWYKDAPYKKNDIFPAKWIGM